MNTCSQIKRHKSHITTQTIYLCSFLWLLSFSFHWFHLLWFQIRVLLCACVCCAARRHLTIKLKQMFKYPLVTEKKNVSWFCFFLFRSWGPCQVKCLSVRIAQRRDHLDRFAFESLFYFFFISLVVFYFFVSQHRNVFKKVRKKRN